MKLLSKIADELTMENEMLHAENALKLTQILNLEIILFDTRKKEFDDECGACWCDGYVQDSGHLDFCQKARQATEHFWKL